MSALSISTGLISGLDIAGLIEVMSLNQQRVIDKLNLRIEEDEVKKSAIAALEANLLTMASSTTTLGSKITFEQFSVSNNAEQQLRISAGKTADPGSYVFQALQKSTSHQALSRGYADTDTQTIGEGTLTISQGGFLDESTLLESLNDGAGIRRGQIRITDRRGISAIVDLSKVISVDDVLSAINESVDLSVTARVVDGQFVLEDTSGSSVTELTVRDLNGGHTADDLGIRKSIANSTLVGEVVYEVTESFSLQQINDGNQLRLLQGAADMRITLTDGSKLEVNLDGSKSLRDILNKINNHTSNSGRVEAKIEQGRIVLNDLTGGAGTLSVENINQTSVVNQLGLNATAQGSTLTGHRLSGGMNSVLLRNLKGGQGIEQPGEVALTDRTGQQATIDLSSAETLSEVIEAINSATDTVTGERLFLKASLNSQGNGIQVVDTSGATDFSMVIEDVAGSTIAQDLNLMVDAAVSEVNSGSLSLRFVNEATLLAKYAPDGGAVEEGLFKITDSSGNVGVITLTSAAKSVGDVIQRINANTSISVRAELNETGDGFVLIDEAGGSGTLNVEEFGETTTAADLRLLGDAKVNEQGQQQISSRMATLIEVDADDTLDDIVTKLNEAGSMVSASIFNDGTQYNSNRVSLSARQAGQQGRLLIDDGDLNLNFGTIIEAQDAILQVGGNPASAFLLTSQTNSFVSVVKGIDVDIRDVGAAPATIEIAANTENVYENVERFVSTYNQFIDIVNELTKFDSENNERGFLQGDGFLLRVSSRMSNSVTSRVNTTASNLNSLASLGIRIGDTGKLELDEDKLRGLLKNNLADVKQFFTAETAGFADKLEATLKSMTDVVDGTFTNEKNILNTSIDRTTQRIEQLGVLMENKKSRLLTQFVAMENILGRLQSQQSAIGGIQPIKMPG